MVRGENIGRPRKSGTPRIDKRIEADGGSAVFVQADVTRRADCDRMVAAALEAYGDLDILFNNAGTGVRGRDGDLSDEDWNFVLDTNLNSIYHGVRAAQLAKIQLLLTQSALPNRWSQR